MASSNFSNVNLEKFVNPLKDFGSLNLVNNYGTFVVLKMGLWYSETRDNPKEIKKETKEDESITTIM